MKVKELVDYIVGLKGSGLNQDEGVLFGDAEAEIKGILITWMPTVKALQTARRRGCNVVLCHETFYFMPMHQNFAPQHITWRANRRRVEEAAAGKMTVLRVHGSLDWICIYDDAVAALGIENPTPGTGWQKVFPIPETTVEKLVEKVKKATGLKTVRVAGDLKKRVKCVGLPWGGLGLDSNIPYMARLVEMGADVFIAGEADEYGMTFANDCGVPLIETGHSVSENFGLKNFAKRLRREFPGLKVVFFADTRPFRFR